MLHQTVPAVAAARRDGLTAARLTRIRALVALAHGMAPESLVSPKAGAARSLAIALSRSLLLCDLGVLAPEFGCRDAEEVAAHCNRIARRAEEDSDFRNLMAALARVAATVLGLDRG